MPKPLQVLVTALASLRLTVGLFAVAMVLIFAGTLAQVHAGIWQVMDEYFRTPVAWIELQLFVPEQLATVPGYLPFPGGYVLGGLMIVNLLAAHAVRFKLSTKRVGIILLHLGIIVLLVGEFVTGMFADEGLMTIREGSYTRYVEDVREAELVVMDRSHGEHDSVVAIPEHMLRGGDNPINHEALPFDIRIERWYANSRIFNRTPTSDSPADRGAGLEMIARPQPLAKGIDGMELDLPAAYITLSHDGRRLGTWLVAELLEPSQTVEVDGRTYHLDLRFKRTYMPYTMHLQEFTHDRFVGTERPRNFASHIRLVDPTQNEDREVVISMNNPLRYSGATFYQSAYLEDDVGTVLQVVRNPGWLLPYIACALVAMGMLMHFGMGLWRFAARTRP